jgi:hypothetical protein
VCKVIVISLSNLTLPFKSALFRKDNLKTPASIVNLRKDRETYRWFLDNIASCVVGKERYSQRNQFKPTQWLTVSSEAFAQVCYKNYYDHIMDICTNKSVVRPPIYTGDGKGAKRNQGWNTEGLTEYREMCDSVAKDRKKYIDTEEWYLNCTKEKMSKGILKKRRRDDVTSLRETGWALTYEDDMSVGEGADQEDEMHTGPVVNNNTNAINDEITQSVGL